MLWPQRQVRSQVWPETCFEWAGIAQSLRASLYWDRITVGARISAPVQTCPGAHPASYTMATGSLSRG